VRRCRHAATGASLMTRHASAGGGKLPAGRLPGL